MLELLLVRHAHADWVPDERRPLSERGRRQAGAVARLLIPRRPEAIYSSPYRRSLETVAPLADALGLAVEPVEELRERTLAEGPVADFELAMRRSWEDFSRSFPGGETSAAAQRRIWSAFERLVERHPSGTVAAGTHGNILALLLHRIDPVHDYRFWCQISWPDVYAVRVERRRVVEIERLWEPVGEHEGPGQPEERG